MEVPFYSQAATYREDSFFNGVIGLSKSKNTFPYNYLSNADDTLSLSRVFTLSYGPANEPSIFTMDKADERFYDPADTWQYAEAVTYTPNPNWWAVEISKATYGPFHIDDLNSIALIEHQDWSYELTYKVFNPITNYIIYNHPEFTRDENLMLSAPGACPSDLDTLTFWITPSSGSQPVSVGIKPEDYTHHDAKADVCHILFKPSNDTQGKLGVSVLETYVTEFDYDNNRIGLIPRKYTAQ